MKHPTREEWMSFLYDEEPTDNRAALQSHLEACAECSARLQTWQSATRELDNWRLPSRRKVVRRGTFVRWAAAAAVIGLATIGADRIATLNNEVRQLRAEMQRSSQNDFHSALAQAAEHATRSANAEAQAMIAAVAQRLEERRLADQQATFDALQKLNARHTEDFASMRKELETVAVFTEAGWQRAQNQLANVAYSPANLSNNKQD
jgi:hypothetical protein